MSDEQLPIPFDVWWEESVVPVTCFADSQAAKTARNLILSTIKQLELALDSTIDLK